MLMKCKPCEKEFIPPRKNILICSMFFFKKGKNKSEENIKEASESEQNYEEESESDEQNEAEEKI